MPGSVWMRACDVCHFGWNNTTQPNPGFVLILLSVAFAELKLMQRNNRKVVTIIERLRLEKEKKSYYSTSGSLNSTFVPGNDFQIWLADTFKE